MKNDKGVTLIVLIITIIILIILAGVGIKTVSFELDNVKLKSFYTKLDTAREVVQKINDTNESYRDEENNLIIIKQQGTVPTEEQNNLIKQVLGTDNLTGYNFRYFTAEQVENILGISGADLNLLIDFESNTIINPEGIEIIDNENNVIEDLEFKLGNIQLNDTFKFTDEGDFVIDPFMGLGTTGVSCVKFDRYYFGFEIFELYHQECVKRLEKTQRERGRQLF